MSNSDLSMILKLLQQIVGEFPLITLRGMGDRPEDLRKWRYAVLTSLKAAGPQVEAWWKWSVSAADNAHKLYVQSPLMTRESITVAQRTSVKWQQLESWVRPKLIACLPDALKKLVTARGMQNIEDECQDVLYLLTKACMPGAADERSAVNTLLQNPTPCSKPESAQAEMQRWWQAGRRCRDLGMSSPDVTVLYTAFRSIFSNVFAVANSNLQLRWMNLENELGLPYVITFDKLYKVAEFVDGEIAFMITQGGRGNNPGLPLTDNQKRQELQVKETEKKRAASAKAATDTATKQAAADAAKIVASYEPQAAAGFTPFKKDTSTTHAPWANTCNDWVKGKCVRGISCNFKHEGIKFTEGRCFICGAPDHTARDCESPGGQKDPKKDENWAAYKKMKEEKMPAQKGKGKGKGGDSKGKGKGKPHVKAARASAVTVDESFPKGGLGLDSWANVMLKHVDPSEVEQWNSKLKLAHGECECELSTGEKGIPTSKVAFKEGGENIDLLLLGWLWSRGCDYTWNRRGPSIKTPKSRYLQVLMWGLLPYIEEESVKLLLDDLPEANVPGRATDNVDPQVCGARVSRGTAVNLDHLQGELDIGDIRKQKAKYNCLPEVYYGDEEQVVKPEHLEDWAGSLDNKKFDPEQKPMFSFWEWYSGSGVLSKCAAQKGVSHLPPIDYRYGWSIGNLKHQICLVYILLFFGVKSLFGAPNCFPWGRDSRATPEAERKRKRSAESGNLKFFAMICFLQFVLGRSYYAENPKGSEIFVAEESPLSPLQTMDVFQWYIDQCMRGARLEGQAIMKSTEIQSCVKMKKDITCDKSHSHLHLRGSGPGGSRTAQSAMYPDELCEEYLDVFVPVASAGGRFVDCTGFQRKSTGQQVNF